VGELFAMLGQPHMLDLLNLLVARRGSPMRFTALQSELKLSPKTLAARLRTLVEGGFLTRRSFNEIPPRVEYEVTDKAIELGELFAILRRWAERNTMTAVPSISVVGKFARPPVAA
jgi:DNA-binding HxlR family transcriptional regulator